MADTDAFLNHGKLSNERKNSFPSSSNQIPCFEICVTSASEVSVPSFSDFNLRAPRSTGERSEGPALVSHNSPPVRWLVQSRTSLRRERNNMNMHPRFFTRKEEETKTKLAKYCGTHIALSLEESVSVQIQKDKNLVRDRKNQPAQQAAEVSSHGRKRVDQLRQNNSSPL